MQIKIVACVALLAPALVVQTPSFAFTPELHHRYTLLGGKHLKQCSRAIDPWLVAKLATGALKEDKTKIWQRVTNWHYAETHRMAAEGILWPLPLYGDRNLNRIFEIRIRELEEAIHNQDANGVSRTCRAGDVFERAGRVLHFIQDMRVPGHVIPIHHGSILGDDAFDSYVFDYPFEPDCKQVEEAVEAADAAISAGSLGSHFRGRLNVAREHTRATIDDPKALFGKSKCSAAQIFWCVPDTQNCRSWPFGGFGEYREHPERSGEKGQVAFGAAEVPCEHDIVRATPQDYADFFEKGYKAMMMDIAFVLRYAQRAASACQQ